MSSSEGFYKHSYVNLFNDIFNKMYSKTTAEVKGITLNRIWRDHQGSINPKVQPMMDDILTLASEALKEQTK